jgi:hypothetical protein
MGIENSVGSEKIATALRVLMHAGMTLKQVNRQYRALLKDTKRIQSESSLPRKPIHQPEFQNLWDVQPEIKNRAVRSESLPPFVHGPKPGESLTAPWD